MSFQNDETTPCSGQPWESCGWMGITPGLPPASLPAAHPRARRRRDPRVAVRFPLALPWRLQGCGAGGLGVGGDGPPTARRSAPPPPGRAEKEPRGRAKKRAGAAAPAGEGIPSARRARGPPPPPHPAQKRIGFCRRVGGKGRLSSSHHHPPLPARIPEKGE